MNYNKTADKLIRDSIPHFSLHIAFAFILYLSVRLIALLPAVVMSRIIDVYIPDRNVKAILLSIILFVVLPVINAGISAFQQHRIAVSGRKLGQVLFIKCFEKIVYQPLRFFDTNNSGELATYCRSEAMEYVLLWIMDLPQMLSNFAVSAVVFVMLIRVHPLLAVMQLLYIPILILPSKWFGKMTERFAEQMMQYRGKSGQIVSDTFRGIRTVKSLLLEKRQISKLETINKNTVNIWSKSTALENIHGVWINVLVDSLFVGVTFGLGAYFVIRGSVTVGGLILFLNYMPQFFSIVKDLSHMNFNFHKQLGQYKKLFEILSMEDERDIPCDNLPFSCNRGIEAKNITFAYDETRGNVLDNFSVNVKSGEWLAVTGPSGIGKSTLLQLMIGNYPIENGEILFDGTPAAKISRKEIRENIAYVAQEPYLFPGTLRENLELALPNGSTARFLSAMEDVGLGKFVSELADGLDTEIGENGVQLSGGQKQRIAIAQGILRGSPVMLLDEITSNLDTETEEEICNMIQKLRREKNLTLISVTHRPMILKYADRSVALG